MIEQFVNFVIRPPRAEYNPNQYLWEEEFNIGRRKYKRIDLELKNARGHTLKCSHYVPFSIPENTALPCVIYCHGNSGCRADANEAAVILLPSNITVFTLDFSGSGLSDGDYVSLGWHEKDDLKVVVEFLRSTKQVSCIGLWGRSMGAVTSLLYGAEDPSIAGMVLDSAFSNLFNLMLELSEVYKVRLPKFTVRMALQYMRRIIQKKAKFDIMNLKTVQSAPKTFIPALFGHASEDIFVPPHHSDIIYQAYAGDKNIIKFEGDHNSPRPQFYYDSVSIFFYNVLRPPHIPSTFSNKMYCDLGDRKVIAGTNENLLYEIITGLRAAGSDVACSSSAATSVPRRTDPNTKSIAELLSESIAGLSTENSLDFIVDEDNKLTEIEGNDGDGAHIKDKTTKPSEERCSASSSNRESWGRCSSLGEDSEGSSSAESDENSKRRHQISLKALATPLRRMKGKSLHKDKSSPKTKKKKKSKIVINKPKIEILENKDSLGQRLRLCFLGRPSHKRCQSS